MGNEGCLGGCTMMDEHYQYNLTRIESPQYFNDPISRVSCPKWDVEDPSSLLKAANIPPWREDWVELLDYVDVFKMHGRESSKRMFETMDIVARYDDKQEILFDTFNEYLEETNLEGRPIDGWRKKIKNCKFNCWDCNYCDNVYKAKSEIYSDEMILTVTKELVDSVNSDYQPTVKGLTSPRVQKLLHALAKTSNVYLEIGAGIGATSSAVGDSGNVEMHVVDSWLDEVIPHRKDIEIETNCYETFEKNTANHSINVHYTDMFDVKKDRITNVDLFFYDGPHDFESTRDAVKYYVDCLSEKCIMIFDDANWVGVVQGAKEGLRQAGLDVTYEKIILNEVENPDQWWNGIYVVVAKKTDKIFTNFIS